jgi:hypothetical protein
MLTYKVKYRLPGQLFFKTIKNVLEDDVFAEGRMRFFTTVSDERFEIPTTAEFYYSKDRLKLINYNIRQQNK